MQALARAVMTMNRNQGLGSGRFYGRFRQNVVNLLVAILPTFLEAAATANRFRFKNPDRNTSLKLSIIIFMKVRPE